MSARHAGRMVGGFDAGEASLEESLDIYRSDYGAMADTTEDPPVVALRLAGSVPKHSLGVLAEKAASRTLVHDDTVLAITNSSEHGRQLRVVKGGGRIASDEPTPSPTSSETTDMSPSPAASPSPQASTAPIESPAPEKETPLPTTSTTPEEDPSGGDTPEPTPSGNQSDPPVTASPTPEDPTPADDATPTPGVTPGDGTQRLKSAKAGGDRFAQTEGGGSAPAWAPDSGLIDTGVLSNGRRKVFNMLRWANQSDLSAFAGDTTSPRGYPYEHDLKLIDCTGQWWASHNGLTYGTTFPESAGPYLNDAWPRAPGCDLDLTAGVYSPTQLYAATDYSTVIYTGAGATNGSGFELRAERLQNSCTGNNEPSCVGEVETEIQRHALIPRGDSCRVPSLHEWDTDQTVPPCSGTSIETTCLSGYATQVQRDNPRAHLCLGEASGTVANDETANNLDGTYVNTPSLGAQGIPGGGTNTAVAFNGTNQYLELPDANDPTKYTLETWVKLNSTANQAIIQRTPPGGPSNGHSHELLVSGGKFQHYVYDGVQRFVTGQTIVQIGVWYHVVGVATNNGAMKLYVNGQQEAEATTIGNLWTGGDRWYIASNDAMGDGYLNGTLDEVAIYPQVLSDSQILFHYQAGSGVAKPLCTTNYADQVGVDAPRAHFCLGEDSGGVAYDETSNHLDGTYRNGATLGLAGIPGAGSTTAVGFNGIDQYIQVRDATDPTQYTIEAWVKMNSTIDQSIIMRSNARPSNDVSHQLRVTSGKFQHYLYDGSQRSVTGTTIVQAGVWYHVAGVATSNGAMRLYVNGQQDGERNTIGSLWTGGDRWFIGSDSAMGASYFNGTIDEVAIYPTALSGLRIEHHHESGSQATLKECESDYAEEIVSDEPRAQLCFGENSGKIVNDETPQELDGFYRNGPSLSQPGIPAAGENTAAAFNGIDQYVEVPDANDPTQYTIEAWVKLDSTAEQAIIQRTPVGGPTGGHSHELRFASGKFQHYLYDGNQRFVTGTTTVQTGVWYHVAGVATNGGSMKLYVNGREEGNPVTIGSLWNGGDRWYIASSDAMGSGYLDGTLDEIAIYPTALSSSRIAEHAGFGLKSWHGGTLRTGEGVATLPWALEDFEDGVETGNFLDPSLHDEGGSVPEVPCQSEDRVIEAVYVAKSGQSRLDDALRARIRLWLRRADMHLDNSYTKVDQHFRWACNGANEIIIHEREVTVGPDGKLHTDEIRTQLQGGAVPLNNSQRIYATFVDGRLYCCDDRVEIGGLGGGDADDDSPRETNRNNTGPRYAFVAGPVDNFDDKYFGGVAAHELAHTLGAVYASSIHNDGGAHCFDDFDVLCTAKNRLSRPEARVGSSTDAFSAVGANLSSANNARCDRDGKALKTVTDGVKANEGFRLSNRQPITGGAVYRFRVCLAAPLETTPSVRLIVGEYDSAGEPVVKTKGTPVSLPANGNPKRLFLTQQVSSRTAVVELRVKSSVTQSVTFFADKFGLLEILSHQCAKNAFDCVGDDYYNPVGSRILMGRNPDTGEPKEIWNTANNKFLTTPSSCETSC